MPKNNWRQKSTNHASSNDFLGMHRYTIKSEDLFRLQVPKFFKKQIDFSNPNDPLLLQVLPSKYELDESESELDDPVGDLVANKAQGVIHKYNGRVLLIATGTCAINCRYCFRRNFPYKQNFASKNNWSEAIKYIKNNASIHEVILSGGDPLMLSTKVLTKLSKQLKDINHVKTLRIHTRLPLVTPSRISNNFIKWLNGIDLNTVMVLHCNHPNELSEIHKPIFNAISNTNTTLLNQSVLLKNINDNSEILTKLSHKLFEYRILPYYLNQLDKATGTSHFEVSEKKAKSIYLQLLKNLSGYLVPKFVKEISGKNNKTPLF